MFLGNGFYQTKRGHGIFKVLPVAISSIIYNYAPDTVSVFWNTEMNTTGCASGTGECPCDSDI